MPVRECIVLIPAERGGNYDYAVRAESSCGAAWQALQAHDKRNLSVDDDKVVLVIVEGRGLMFADYHLHNARQPQYRHRVERVREWGRANG